MSLLVLLSHSPTHSPSQDCTLSLSPAACLSLPLPVSLLYRITPSFPPLPFCWSVSQPVSVHPHAVFSLSAPPFFVPSFSLFASQPVFPSSFSLTDGCLRPSLALLSQRISPSLVFFLLSLLCTIPSLVFAQAHQVTLWGGGANLHFCEISVS